MIHTTQPRRDRDRIARRRRAANIEALRTGSDMLLVCDSHKQMEILARMLVRLISLLKLSKVSDDDKQLLAHIFEEAGHEHPYVRRDGNILFLEGSFKINELAKRMIWQGVFDQGLRGIAEEEDE